MAVALEGDFYPKLHLFSFLVFSNLGPIIIRLYGKFLILKTVLQPLPTYIKSVKTNSDFRLRLQNFVNIYRR